MYEGKAQEGKHRSHTCMVLNYIYEVIYHQLKVDCDKFSMYIIKKSKNNITEVYSKQVTKGNQRELISKKVEKEEKETKKKYK